MFIGDRTRKRRGQYPLHLTTIYNGFGLKPSIQIIKLKMINIYLQMHMRLKPNHCSNSLLQCSLRLINIPGFLNIQPTNGPFDKDILSSFNAASLWDVTRGYGQHIDVFVGGNVLC